MRIFPRSLIHGLFLSIKDLYIAFMAIGSILSLVSILSFSVWDNSLNVATHIVTANWLGVGGAFFADLCWQFFGFFSYVVPFILSFYTFCGVLGYFDRYWSNSLTLFLFGFLQLLVASTYFQASFASGVKNTGALGLLLLQCLKVLLVRCNAIELLGGCAVFFVISGVFFASKGLGITENHLVKCWELLNKFACYVRELFTTQKEYTIKNDTHSVQLGVNAAPINNENYLEFDEEQYLPVDDVLEPANVVEPINNDLPESSTQKAKKLIKKLHSESLTRADGYMLPTVALLDDTQQRKIIIDNQELQQQAANLMKVLEEFGIKGEIENIRSGPVVTMYELKPAPGIKTARVIGLADDIARSMSAISARIATIPGQNAIGIELPNKKRQTVYMRDLLLHDEFTKTNAPLPLILGQDIVGVPIIANLARMPHLLVAGTTGSGKSVSVNAMILSILFRLSPDECRFIMIDPKMLELSVYNDIPHLLTPVVTEPKKAIVALKWAVKEMETRYRNMAKLGVRNIDGYNARLKEAKEKGEIIARRVQTGFDQDTGQAIFENQVLDLKILPYIVVVIDEMADLMLVAGKEVEAAVQRLAQMARAAGIHLIMATQRPSVDVITGTIKANFPTRISFQVTSKIDSRTILGEQGAEQLLGQGDMLYMSGVGRVLRVHGPFVKDSEVEDVVAFLKQQGEPNYVDDVTTDTEDTFSAGDAGNEGGDAVYAQAVELIKRENKISTSFIQRHFQIGYNRAARIVEMMEKQGIVSSANHQGKREILVS